MSPVSQRAPVEMHSCGVSSEYMRGNAEIGERSCVAER